MDSPKGEKKSKPHEYSSDDLSWDEDLEEDESSETPALPNLAEQTTRGDISLPAPLSDDFFLCLSDKISVQQDCKKGIEKVSIVGSDYVTCQIKFCLDATDDDVRRRQTNPSLPLVVLKAHNNWYDGSDASGKQQV